MDPLPGSSCGEDLLSGVNEWRNIQDVVRLTLKSFHDVLKSQAETIQDLGRRLEGKVGEEDFSDLRDRQRKAELRADELESQVRRAEETTGPAGRSSCRSCRSG